MKQPLALLAAFCVAAAMGGALAGRTLANGPLDHRDDLSAEDRERVFAITRPTTDFSSPEKFELRPAGAGTEMSETGRNAFSQFLANLSFEQEQRAKVGNGIFKKLWVSAPSSTAASDGLGPLYNARACQRCHLKDGRGHPPAPGERGVSMFLRLSIPGEPIEDGVLPEPTYGQQLQNFAIPGHVAEGQMQITYEDVTVPLRGGETVTLRKPTYAAVDLGYGPMRPDTLMSPRVANPMIGLGLLDAIHPGDILANADPDDADGDGISGRANEVRSDLTGELTLGRFGWKAGMPTVRQQAAHAFAGDIGISTPLMPAPWGDCTLVQTDCRAAPTGVQERLGDVEGPDEILDLVSFYASNLAPPARRDIDDPQVLAGKELFYELNCVSCHVPKYVTRREGGDMLPAQAFQLIWPYTDLLLHDMGEGLADNRPEWRADGREWRTPPLWGIGLTEQVNGHTFFLHDGRARNLTEAILWHGGEAQTARDGFADLEPEARAAVLAFLESL